MSQISATLGPVCMIMLGMTMTEVKWKDIFSHSRIYLITILKMVVTPLLILLFLKYLPLDSMVKDGKTILLISLMAVITPSATTVVQLAQLYDRSYGSGEQSQEALLPCNTALWTVHSHKPISAASAPCL